MENTNSDIYNDALDQVIDAINHGAYQIAGLKAKAIKQSMNVQRLTKQKDNIKMEQEEAFLSRNSAKYTQEDLDELTKAINTHTSQITGLNVKAARYGVNIQGLNQQIDCIKNKHDEALDHIDSLWDSFGELKKGWKDVIVDIKKVSAAQMEDVKMMDAIHQQLYEGSRLQLKMFQYVVKKLQKLEVHTGMKQNIPESIERFFDEDEEGHLVAKTEYTMNGEEVGIKSNSKVDFNQEDGVIKETYNLRRKQFFDSSKKRTEQQERLDKLCCSDLSRGNATNLDRSSKAVEEDEEDEYSGAGEEELAGGDGL